MLAEAAMRTAPVMELHPCAAMVRPVLSLKLVMMVFSMLAEPVMQIAAGKD
jgi:hypothetical protein